MAVPSVALGNPTRIHQDAIISATPGVLVAVQLNGGTDTCSLLFHNHASSASGTELYSIVAPFTDDTSSSNSTVYVKLPDEGIKFDVGCYVALTGTVAIGWAWFR